MREIEDRIEKIAEEYLDSLQRGESPDRQAICARHPDIAEPLGRRLRLVEIIYEMRWKGRDQD
jgi:hypothetical protein